MGRMLAASASLLNVPISILDVGQDTPAKQVVAPIAPLSHVDGSFTSPLAIKQLARQVDVLTVEIEHVNVDVLDEVQKETGIEVHPSPQTIRIIQDKFNQKEHLRKHGLPLADYALVDPTPEGIKAVASHLGLPLMLKSRTLAYDGRGNYVLKNLDDNAISDALAVLSGRPLYAERWVPFVKEAAVMAVRTKGGTVHVYPLVETVHKENICHLVFAPFRAPGDVSIRAQRVAENVVRSFDGAGVFGVELFILEDSKYHFKRIG